MASVLTHSLTSVFDVGFLIGGDEESVSELLNFAAGASVSNCAFERDH